MKTILITLLLSLLFLSIISGQVKDNEIILTSQELYDFHMKQKKSNTTIAWAMVSGGLAMIVGGTAINIQHCLFTNCSDGRALTYLGIGTGLASAIFFSQAVDHKKKARLQLQDGAAFFNPQYKYAGLSLSFSF